MSDDDEFTIESDVPPPVDVGRRGVKRNWAYALSIAPIGSSVLIQGAPAAAHAYGNGWITRRKVDGGNRVWKIAEPEGRRAKSRRGSGDR